MHQLRALIWKSYKVRTRSYYITILDLLAPILVMLMYVIIRIVLNYTHDIQIDDDMKEANYFHNVSRGQINLKQDIRLRVCQNVLYHSNVGDDSSFSSYLTNECGLKLERVSSRYELVKRLKKSLDLRVAFKQEKTDLNKMNSTSDACIKLPPSETNSSSDVIYQIGIQRASLNSFEIHMTDSAGSSVIHVPYTQGSTYNEYKLPTSDLNLSYHLIEICLSQAYKHTVIPARPTVNTTAAAPTSTSTTKAPTTSTTKRISVTRSPKKASSKPKMAHDRQATVNATTIDNVKWSIRPYPAVTGVYLLPVGTIVLLLIAFLCTNIATIIRICDASECGLHRYTRLSGLPSGFYWLSEFSLSVVSNFIQALIIAIILGISAGNYPYDPICDTSMTLRFMLLFTYSLLSTSHAMFFASLFGKSSYALLAFCLLASTYGMYPLLLILQWTPYGFTPVKAIAWIALINPGSNFEALCAVLIGVAMQNNETFGWSHLSDRIVNGGFSDLSVGELWAIMVAQTIFWLSLTIFIDQYYFSTTTNFFGFITSQLNEFCCCNSCGFESERLHGEMTKGKSVKSGVKSLVSRQNPNRICCSLRHLGVRGFTKMTPYTKGNPLKFPHEQMHAMKAKENDNPTRTDYYLVNRKLKTPSHSHQKEEPILLDEAIKQNIVWYKTRVKFENLNLDFRFNQVTFILGQTDLKELLFETILGLYPLDSGSIIIDDVKYSSSTMGLARHHIGYLSDKDIFFPELSIFENLQLFGSLRDPTYKSFDSESLYVLSLLHLSSRRDDLPSSLTQRSARKLALAVALVGYTKLLLLTEPTLNLRWRPRCQVYNLLKKYKSIRSIVVDTSDVDEAVAFGDRITLLKNGSADLNDEPKRMAKKLGCGFRLVFEPTTGDGHNLNPGAVRALEKLTRDIFKNDKIDLDSTKRSIYQDLDHPVHSKSMVKSKMSPKSPRSPISPKSPTSLKSTTNPPGPTSSTSPKSPRSDLTTKITNSVSDLHRAIVIVKIQHTNNSVKGLCTILKMFSSNNIHGFRLAQINYESLEDILVSRMSRAIYPDLPPDLLLSLQHRTQVYHKSQDSMPITVRRLSARMQPKQSAKTSIFDSGIVTIIKDRFGEQSEIALLVSALISSLVIIAITLLSLKYSLKSDDKHYSFEHANRSSTNRAFQQDTVTDHQILQHTMIDRLYKYRIGFYILEHNQYGSGSDVNISTINGNSSTLKDRLLQSWRGNRNLLGVINLSLNDKTDSQIVATLIDNSKDLAGSMIIYDPRSSETIVIYEPHLPHMLLASIRAFVDFALSLRLSDVTHYGQTEQQRNSPSSSSTSPSSSSIIDTEYTQLDNNGDKQTTYFKTSRYNFHQPWHEMIQGFSIRRLIYGVGFALAEAISIGVLVVAPIRHRSSSHTGRAQIQYWFKMAIVDFSISLLNIFSYLFLFIVIEGVTSGTLIFAILLVLFLYKLASLPIPYLASLLAESSLFAFLFILLIYFTFAWDLAIFIRSFVDWTLISSHYTYTVANWIFFGLPITALIESLTVINQINNIQARCPDVPAYVATRNIVELEGVHRYTIIDSLLEKVRECLANGKTFVSTDVLHGQSLGILWSIYLIILFALISWIFLLTCEQLFGLTVRRASDTRTTNDPMKTVIRLPDSNSSLFAWDKEKDRLISEYIKCINEIRYVKTMAKNCLILRIWLKPLDNQTSMDGRLSNILDPLMSLGYTKNDVQIELRTTLQVFIRLGDESKRCRVDKINLIETFSKYAATHSDLIDKFAVVNWTRENLYKIVLHGYYNNKTVLP